METKKPPQNSYQIPPNPSEHQRLNRQHGAIQAMMLGKVFQSPIKNPTHILDVGCGTGAVTCYLGTQFPSAQTIGVDLAAVPPNTRTPPNVSFTQGDYHDLLGSLDPYVTPASMDFVFSRLLICGMTTWLSYIHACHTLLRPNGWLEIQEPELTYYNDSGVISADWEWLRAYQAGAKAKSLDLSCAVKAAEWMREAGFVDVQTKKYCWPHGEWMAERGYEEYRAVGKLLKEEQPRLHQVILANLVSGMDYGEDEVKRLQLDVLKTLEVEEGKHRNFWVTFGRKGA